MAKKTSVYIGIFFSSAGLLLTALTFFGYKYLTVIRFHYFKIAFLDSYVNAKDYKVIAGDFILAVAFSFILLSIALIIWALHLTQYLTQKYLNKNNVNKKS